jgi:hypothetical protein
MIDGSIVAFDGAWSDRRRAKECIVILVDCRPKKIVDFEIQQHAKHCCPGNYFGSPNGMEIAAFKSIALRWRSDSRVVSCVHDNDARASKVIRDLNWKISEFFDPNHVVKQFENRWSKLPTNLLRGFHAKLLHWFRYLIRSDYPPEERQHYWLNSVEHFKGNHEGCPREHLERDDTVKILTLEAEDQLIHVLQETVELVIRTRHDLDTQLCESFNSVKAKFAEKDISWRISWPIRVMCAILHMNSETN